MPTDNFYNEIFASNSGNPVLSLIRVEIDGQYEYYVNNNEAITSNASGVSQTYQPAAFSIALPEDTQEGTPSATLDLDAADIQVVRKLRQANNRIILDLWVVVADNPNVVERGPYNYQSTEVSINETRISLRLEAEPILDIEIPGKRYTPTTFPGLWRES